MTTQALSEDALRGFLTHLETTNDVDFLRSLLKRFVEELMSADVDNQCGAAHGQRSSTRTNQRNGYRERPWDTRLGSITLEVPKVRKGTYFPEWLLERRRRAERALVSVVAQAYVLGVSTRRVDGLVKALGMDGISKSQVSEMAKTLDDEVQAFRNRRLDKGPYVYVWVDAMMVRVREAGHVVGATATSLGAGGCRPGSRPGSGRLRGAELVGVDRLHHPAAEQTGRRPDRQQHDAGGDHRRDRHEAQRDVVERGERGVPDPADQRAGDRQRDRGDQALEALGLRHDDRWHAGRDEGGHLAASLEDEEWDRFERVVAETVDFRDRLDAARHALASA